MRNSKILPILLLFTFGQTILGTSAAGESSEPSVMVTAPTADSPTGAIQTSMLTSYATDLASQSSRISVPLQWTISTVYTTREHTVTSCAAAVTNCPADSTRTLTSTIAISTTSRPITGGDWTRSWPTSLETVPSNQTSSCSRLNNDCSALDSDIVQTMNHTFSPIGSSSFANESPTFAADTTIYTTREITVTSCADTVTDCPARSTQATTSTFGISTPTPPKDKTSDPGGNLSTASIPPIETPSTVYTTRKFTVTSCAPDVLDCPGRSTHVLTSTNPLPPTESPATDTSQEESGSTSVRGTTESTLTSSSSSSTSSSGTTLSTNQPATSSNEPAPSSEPSALPHSTVTLVVDTTTTLCSATITVLI